MTSTTSTHPGTWTRVHGPQAPVVKVLVATDGSPEALAAAWSASKLLCQPLDVVMLNVITDPPGEDAGGIEGPVATPEEERTEWARDEREAREAIREAAEAFDGITRSRIEVGDAGPAICAVAEELGAEMIVMGTRGRGMLRSLLFGSTVQHVIRHSHCPVLLGHADARPARRLPVSRPS